MMDSYREIEKLIFAYAEHLDGGDLAAVAALFSHAEFYGPDGKLAARGAQEFLAMQKSAVKIYSETGTPRTKHVTTNLVIDIAATADSASAKSYFTVLQAVEGLALQPIIAGRYQDEFAYIDGQWRFSKRQAIPELIGDLSQHLLYDLNTGRR